VHLEKLQARTWLHFLSLLAVWWRGTQCNTWKKQGWLFNSDTNLWDSYIMQTASIPPNIIHLIIYVLKHLFKLCHLKQNLQITFIQKLIFCASFKTKFTNYRMLLIYQNKAITKTAVLLHHKLLQNVKYAYKLSADDGDFPNTVTCSVQSVYRDHKRENISNCHG